MKKKILNIDTSRVVNSISSIKDKLQKAQEGVKEGVSFDKIISKLTQRKADVKEEANS
jgi:hypothetical protein